MLNHYLSFSSSSGRSSTGGRTDYETFGLCKCGHSSDGKDSAGRGCDNENAFSGGNEVSGHGDQKSML
jgi:hypothetical protein